MRLILLALMLTTPTWAMAGDPPKINNPKRVKPGEGVVRVSVRSQVQQAPTLYVHFGRIDAEGSVTSQVISFSRSQGVPLAGSNMMDPRPVYYRLPAGRYKLLAHTIGCDFVPMPGAVCVSGYTVKLPTGRYDGASPVLTVSEGKLTDAGDFILELESTFTVRDDYKLLNEAMLNAQMRWRPLAEPVGAAFAAMPIADAPAIPEGYASRVECRKRPKGAGLYIPFTC